MGIETSPAQYDDIYESAAISYNSTQAPCAVDRKVCIGVNADQSTCAAAKSPIPVYANKYITLTCDNCYAGITADVFFDLEIKDFTLQKLAAGMRQAAVTAAMDLDLVG